MKTLLVTLIVAVLVPVFFGCQGYSSTGGPGTNVSAPLRAGSADAAKLRKVHRVVVMPLTIDRGVDRKESSQLGQSYPFYEELSVAAKRGLQLELIQGDSVLESSPPNIPPANSTALAVRMATEFSADASLVTTLHRFQERMGNKLAADRPASLSFSMKLIDSKDGSELWGASYHFRDEALSENLFRIREKANQKAGQRGWRSAYEVLQDGFAEAIYSLGVLRQRQFAN